MSTPAPPTPPIGANKFKAAGFGGSLTVILIWLIGQFHVTVPPEIASAMTVVVSSALTYYVPGGNPDA